MATTNRLFRALDDVGDGSGEKNHVADYSVTPSKALLVPTEDLIYAIGSLQIFIADNATIGADKYGGTKALAEGKGMLLRVEDDEDNVVMDLFDGGEVLTNAGWALLSGQITDAGIGSGANYLFTEINFLSKLGDYLRLDGRSKERLVLHLRDDLTDLLKHYFMCFGDIRPQPPRSVLPDQPPVSGKTYTI
ncbi:MAG: hypothetical protein GY906_13055 [bacterium]|nr:hypothetical protein [bacterium]